MSGARGLKRPRILPYLRDYRFNSILVKSFGTILLLLAVIYIAITLAVSAKMNEIVADEVGSMSVNALAKTRDRIDVVMEEAARISGQLSLDSDVMGYLLPDTETLFGRDQATRVRNKLALYSGVFDYIDTIYVYSHKSKSVVTNEGGGALSSFDDTTWLENLIEREYEPARMISREKYGTYPNLISYIQPIRLTQMQFLGGIIINLDVDRLEELVVPNAKTDAETLIIVDGRGGVLFSSNRKLLGQKIDSIPFYRDVDFAGQSFALMENESGEVLVAAAPSEKFGWTYISAVPLSEYDEYSKSIRAFNISLFFACIIISVFAAFFIALYCYSPVKNILDLLKDPESYAKGFGGETGLRKDETHEIALNIVRNLYSNKQMQEEMKGYADIIDKAQLTALQAQISPHFLYNTLENIRWRSIAASKGENEVSRTIMNLSEMLRISLETGNPIITVEEELRNARLYVEILQLRYEDKLKVVWDVDEDVKRCPIVKVSLQPVIENAVYHGIKPLRRQGVITISAKKSGGRLEIQVRDNGTGIQREEVERLNRDMAEKYTLKTDHIGIRNVNQRLKLLMGGDAGLMIQSAENAGTTVTFRLPVALSGQSAPGGEA